MKKDKKNFGFSMSESQPSHLQPYSAASYSSAANPYSPAAYNNNQFMSGYSPYSNMGGYGGYGGGFGGYGYNSIMGDHMWQGFLGQTAESLGRLNNLLSMTGMLVDHISNHGKLIFSKGVELQNWYESAKNWGQKHTEWMEKLGLQIESSWKTPHDDEQTRRRRMLIRRTRTLIIFAFFVVSFLIFRRRRRVSRDQKWENIYHGAYGRPFQTGPP